MKKSRSEVVMEELIEMFRFDLRQQEGRSSGFGLVKRGSENNVEKEN